MLNVPYDKEEHVGQECYRGPDGVTYVRRQIIWFIRKVCHVTFVISRAHDPLIGSRAKVSILKGR